MQNIMSCEAAAAFIVSCFYQCRQLSSWMSIKTSRHLSGKATIWDFSVLDLPILYFNLSIDCTFELCLEHIRQYLLFKSKRNQFHSWPTVQRQSFVTKLHGQFQSLAGGKAPDHDYPMLQIFLALYFLPYSGAKLSTPKFRECCYSKCNSRLTLGLG